MLEKVEEICKRTEANILEQQDLRIKKNGTGDYILFKIHPLGQFDF